MTLLQSMLPQKAAQTVQAVHLTLHSILSPFYKFARIHVTMPLSLHFLVQHLILPNSCIYFAVFSSVSIYTFGICIEVSYLSFWLMCITIQFSHRNQPFFFRLIIFYHIFLYMSVVLSNISSLLLVRRYRYVHYRITPVIAYQETKAGNSSRHLKRMREFLQCSVKISPLGIDCRAKQFNVRDLVNDTI